MTRKGVGVQVFRLTVLNYLLAILLIVFVWGISSVKITSFVDNYSKTQENVASYIEDPSYNSGDLLALHSIFVYKVSADRTRVVMFVVLVSTFALNSIMYELLDKKINKKKNVN